MKLKFAKFLICAFVASISFGCAPQKQPEPTGPEPLSFVDKRLLDASESISRDMAVLSGSTQNRDFSQRVSDGQGITRMMSLTWDGPIDGALSKIAGHCGFRFIIEGPTPTTKPVVHVKMVDRPCINILREIGMQTGKYEGVLVSETTQTIILRYIDPDPKKAPKTKSKGSK